MTTTEQSSVERAQRKVQQFRAREQAIIDTALELLLEYGEDKVTVEQIAENIGIGKGTIYKHFRSKNEIYVQLLLDYESELTSNLQEALKTSSAAAAHIYFEVRLGDTDRDILFQRLESKLIEDPSVSEQMVELHKLRASNRDALNRMIKKRINLGVLEDVKPEYHFAVCWALAQGAVELLHSPFFENIIEDKTEFLNFVKAIGKNMGRAGLTDINGE